MFDYFSLFETDPEVQGKYFAHMKTDADLEKHGVRVFNAIGAMVKACKDEDDGKLIKKIHEVLTLCQNIIRHLSCGYLRECTDRSTHQL